MIFITLSLKALRELTMGEALILSFLDVASSKGQSEARTTNQEIAGELGFTPQYVSKVLRELQNKELIQIEKKYGMRFITIPKHVYGTHEYLIKRGSKK